MTEAKFESVVLAAWEMWTLNGLHGPSEETSKTVRDAANNVFRDDMTEAELFAATLARLGG